MLYTVPSGIDDDLFWLLSSVVSSKWTARVTPAWAVTNDCIRDHTAAFLDSVTFKRWRASCVINFNTARPIADEDAISSALVDTVKFWEPGTLHFYLHTCPRDNPAQGNIRGNCSCTPVNPPRALLMFTYLPMITTTGYA